MREYFLNPLLNLFLRPGGMLLPDARGFQFPGRPIERHRRAEFLFARHAPEAFEVFWRSGRGHTVALALRIRKDNRKFPVLVWKYRVERDRRFVRTPNLFHRCFIAARGVFRIPVGGGRGND